MQHILEAILEIDILAPPREYITRILQVICERVVFSFGVAFEYSLQGESRIFTSFNLPERHQALVTQGASEYFASLAAERDESVTAQIHVIHRPDALSAASPWYPLFTEDGINTIIKVPLTYKGKLLGSYDLYDTRLRELSEQEVQLLAQVAEMASVAIASNRYLEQLNQKTNDLQAEVLQRRRMEAALREALRKRKELEEIVNRSPVVVFLWRAADQWPVEFVSQSIEQFGYTQEELYAGDISFFGMIHPGDAHLVASEITQHELDGNVEFVLEYRILTRSGEVRWVENRVWARRDSDGLDLLHVVTPARGVITHYQGILLDITERKQAEEMIRHQAFHDTLTDLPNRILFHDRLTFALARARRNQKMLAAMFLDLDRFKTINDTLGHGVGDQLLKGVAMRLRERLREEDTISRLGGDEFTILLPEIKHTKDAANVARKILEALRPPFHLDGHEVHISTSIGISIFPNDGDDAQALLQNADTALYHAKEQGRNTFQFYNASMNAKTLERLAMENGMRHALARQEFLVYFQPQVQIATGQLIGMESLVRWQHPEMGLIAPGQFIPLAEETGLIEPIGAWVLRQACRQSMTWQQAGFPTLRVAVNLSARQFHQENLVQMVSEVLAETRIDPDYLELEITESVAMRNVDYSVSTMLQLKEMGIHLSMDDFGVGYSSLIHLKKFPINTLKIDQSFIRNLTMDPNDQAIATAIIAMARSLNLHVIAEGVETEDQLAFLRAHHCDGMQGNLFSHPLPADAFEQLLRFLAI